MDQPKLFDDGAFKALKPDYVAPVLNTPGRQTCSVTIWERDDEPDFVLVTVEAHDGDGNLIALRNLRARRDETWMDAWVVARPAVVATFYEAHSPF